MVGFPQFDCDQENPVLPGQDMFPDDFLNVVLPPLPPAYAASATPAPAPTSFGTCEAWASSPSSCSSVVDYEVFVPLGSSQVALAAQAQAQFAQFSALPSECQNVYRPFVCGSSFSQV